MYKQGEEIKVGNMALIVIEEKEKGYLCLNEQENKAILLNRGFEKIDEYGYRDLLHKWYNAAALLMILRNPDNAIEKYLYKRFINTIAVELGDNDLPITTEIRIEGNNKKYNAYFRVGVKV